MRGQFFLLKTVSTKMLPDSRPRDGVGRPEPLCVAHSGLSKAGATRLAPGSRSAGRGAPPGSPRRGPATCRGGATPQAFTWEPGRLLHRPQDAFAEALAPPTPLRSAATSSEERRCTGSPLKPSSEPHGSMIRACAWWQPADFSRQAQNVQLCSIGGCSAPVCLRGPLGASAFSPSPSHAGVSLKYVARS